MRNATIALSAVLTIGLAACRAAGPAEAPTPSAQPVAQAERIPVSGAMGRAVTVGPITALVLGSAEWPAAAQTLGAELHGVSVRVRLTSRGTAVELDGSRFQLVDLASGIRYSAGPGAGAGRDLKLPLALRAGATVEGLLNFTPTRGGRYQLRIVTSDEETALIPLGAIGDTAAEVAAPSASPAAPTNAPAGTACVRIGGGTWDAAGNDDLPPALDLESVKIRNLCATDVAMGGWVVHDQGRDHAYTFPRGFVLAAGAMVLLYSGSGTDSATALHWGRTSGEIWGPAYPERAYLRDAAGRLVSDWSRFKAG